jgi:hypothetical protein
MPLIDVCRLSVDDAYKNGTIVGAYMESAHGKSGEAMLYFRRFLDKAGIAGLLPEWWDDSHTAGVERLAADEDAGRSLHSSTFRLNLGTSCRIRYLGHLQCIDGM